MTEPLQDWLVSRLQQTYRLFVGKRGAQQAAALVQDGRIAVVLDGLDEIAVELQPIALRALSEQASFRLVVLARTAEMATAAEQGHLEGAVAIELQDVEPSAGADYLTRIQLDPPPDGWRDLTARLREAPESPVARALSNPLNLTLVRDTYRSGDNLHELLDLRGPGEKAASPEEIEDLLLHRVLPVAYTSHPGQAPPRYDLQTAQRALCRISARMTRDQTRDLAWWRISSWTPPSPRRRAACLAFGAVFWTLSEFVGATNVSVGLFLLLFFGVIIGFVAVVVAGMIAGFVNAAGGALSRVTKRPRRISRVERRSAVSLSSVAVSPSFLMDWFWGEHWRGSGTPRQLAQFRWHSVFRRSSIIASLAVGLVFGWSSGIALHFSLTAEVGYGLVSGLGFGLLAALRQSGKDNGSSLTPLVSWRRDRTAALVFWLGCGLIMGLFGGPVLGLGQGLKSVVAALAGGLAFGLVSGLVASQTWSASVAFAQLAFRWRTPVRMMHFLNDAQERGILRTVGPVYQFRHARLQDHLASVLHQDTSLTRAADEGKRASDGPISTISGT